MLKSYFRNFKTASLIQKRLALHVFLLIIPHFAFASDLDDQIQKAKELYFQGESSKTVKKRQDAFAGALNIYLGMGKKHADGKLFYNIANTYFQLQSYPLAVLYYSKALQLQPRDKDVQNNLAVTLKKLAIKDVKSYLPQFFLSLSELLGLFFIFGILLTFLLSAFIWRQEEKLKMPIFLLGSLLVVLMLFLGYNRFAAPIRGIVLEASSLYRGSGTAFGKATVKPILAGTKVIVLSVENDSWLKIITPQGDTGYLPLEKVQPI